MDVKYVAFLSGQNIITVIHKSAENSGISSMLSDNYLTFLNKISRFVKRDIYIPFPKKLLNHTKDRYHVIPKTVIFHREIVILPLKNCCITLVCNFSAHLLLWFQNSNSKLFFEMQPVTKK